MEREIERVNSSYDKAILLWEERYGKKWREANPDKAESLTTILKGGYWYTIDNPSHEILLSMLNPSVGKGQNRDSSSATPFPFKQILNRYNPNSRTDFWKPWMENLREYICKDMVAQIDLFPIREGSQKNVRTILPDELKAAILRVTQQKIEELQPKLIIHANKTTGFYYGTNPKYPWMGYQLTRIHDSYLDPKGELYVIEGLQEDERRICYKSIQDTKLKGTFLYVCRQQSGRPIQKAPEQKLTKEDIDYLVQNYYDPR